jgi:O-antigen/teichoic acid export membrane protein
MMVILDRFVIGAQLGAKYVTFYTVPFQLAERTSVIPIALSSALFPRLAQIGLGDSGRFLADKAIRTLIVVITPLFLIGVFVIDWFLAVWIGDDFSSRASLVGQILLLGFWGNAIARIPHALLQASGKPAIVAKCHLAELVPYFFLLYVGLEYFGIVGAAIAFSVRAIADSMILLYWANMLKTSMKFLAAPAVLMGSAIIVARPEYSFWIFTSAGLALLCISICWALVNMPDELSALLRKYAPNIIN